MPLPPPTDPIRSAVGVQLAAPPVRPTTVQLFRFSAATWNAHRIHYDREYARSEGYPDVLVQSHLHGCFIARAVADWAGDGATLRRFRWQNRGIAVPGEQLSITGAVTAVVHHERHATVEMELEERNQDGGLCAAAWAVVDVPAKGTP